MLLSVTMYLHISPLRPHVSVISLGSASLKPLEPTSLNLSDDWGITIVAILDSIPVRQGKRLPDISNTFEREKNCLGNT